MIEPFHIAIAAGPIAVYLLLLGSIRLLGRPLVTTGGRDLATLGFALIGLGAIGPAELFFPRSAASILGPKVWLLILIFYCLCVTLTVLMARPRLIVYGLSASELIEQMHCLMPTLDGESRWLAETIVAPKLGIHAIVESAGSSQVSQITAATFRQNAQGWAHLESALVRHLHGVEINTRTAGSVFLFAGLVLLACVLFSTLRDPQSTIQAMNAMLRR